MSRRRIAGIALVSCLVLLVANLLSWFLWGRQGAFQQGGSGFDPAVAARGDAYDALLVFYSYSEAGIFGNGYAAVSFGDEWLLSTKIKERAGIKMVYVIPAMVYLKLRELDSGLLLDFPSALENSPAFWFRVDARFPLYCTIEDDTSIRNGPFVSRSVRSSYVWLFGWHRVARKAFVTIQSKEPIH